MAQSNGTEIVLSSDPETIASRTIRELVDTYPALLGLLAPLGIDLCCGGAHPLGEALDLHGIDRDPVLEQAARIVSSASRRS